MALAVALADTFLLRSMVLCAVPTFLAPAFPTRDSLPESRCKNTVFFDWMGFFYFGVGLCPIAVFFGRSSAVLHNLPDIRCPYGAMWVQQNLGFPAKSTKISASAKPISWHKSSISSPILSLISNHTWPSGASWFLANLSIWR